MTHLVNNFRDRTLDGFSVDGKCGEGVVGCSAQAQDDDAGDDEGDRHEKKTCARVAGACFKQAYEPGTGESAESAAAIDEGGDLAGDVF